MVSFNGVALVILAIIIDRFTQHLNKPKQLTEKPKTNKNKKKQTFSIVGAVLLVLGGLSVFSLFSDKNDKGTINLAYVEWDSEVASTNVVGEVLKQMGYKVNMTPLDNAIMWESISKGESDAMVSAWLPKTHEAQFEQYKNSLDPLNANLKGAKVGLVVPSYMDVNSIEDLTDEANQVVTGIEPGAGVVSAAEETLKAYPNLKDWKLETASSGAMVVALDQAIKNKEPIVITGWSPHWMFSKYDLKYLEDPKQTMGSEETINTMARKGLKDDEPEAYNVIKNFHWETKDIESIMLKVNNGEAPETAAKDWIKDNPDKVAEWKK